MDVLPRIAQFRNFSPSACCALSGFRSLLPEMVCFFFFVFHGRHASRELGTILLAHALSQQVTECVQLV